jgi:hypothetical protein
MHHHHPAVVHLAFVDKNEKQRRLLRLRSVH